MMRSGHGTNKLKSWKVSMMQQTVRLMFQDRTHTISRPPFFFLLVELVSLYSRKAAPAAMTRRAPFRSMGDDISYLWAGTFYLSTSIHFRLVILSVPPKSSAEHDLHEEVCACSSGWMHYLHLRLADYTTSLDYYVLEEFACQSCTCSELIIIIGCSALHSSKPNLT